MEPQVSALSLTVLALIMVFVVLLGLAFIISLIKSFCGNKHQQAALTPSETSTDKDVTSGSKDSSDTKVAPEIVAAITAALAACLDQGTDQLMVSAIYRLAPSNSWTTAGTWKICLPVHL